MQNVPCSMLTTRDDRSKVQLYLSQSPGGIYPSMHNLSSILTTPVHSYNSPGVQMVVSLYAEFAQRTDHSCWPLHLHSVLTTRVDHSIAQL